MARPFLLRPLPVYDERSFHRESDILIGSADRRSSDILKQLSGEDERLVIALPYRVGLYVSHADRGGGGDADDAERQALKNILREFSEDFCKSEFVQKVLIETGARRDQWPGWETDLAGVPKECARARDALSGLLDSKDLGSFGEIMVDIGMAVAMAFQEEEAPSVPAKANPLNAFLQGLTGKRAPADPFRHINVSAAEKTALRQIASALKHNG